jgi:hypothetical protein
MNKYEAIYDKGWEDKRDTDQSPSAPHPAGLAAVVSAAKGEALKEAADAYEIDPDVTYFPKIVGRWLRQRAGVPE